MKINGWKGTSVPEKGGNQNWKDVLDRLPTEMLRAFLYALAERDERIQVRLMRLAPMQRMTEEECLANWKRTMKQALRGQSSNDGEDSNDPYEPLMEQLHEEVEDLIAEKRTHTAFVIVRETFNTIEAIPCNEDDDEYWQESAAEECVLCCQYILQVTSAATVKEIYQWLSDLFRAWEPPKRFSAAFPFLFAYCWNRPRQQQNLALLDEKIAAVQTNETFVHAYEFVQMLDWREKCMKTLEASSEEIRVFWHQHWDTRIAHHRVLKSLIAEEKWADAIAQVKEDLQHTDGDKRYAQELSITLIDLYRESHQTERYIQALRDNIARFPQLGMLQVEALQDALPSESWHDEAAHLLTLPTTAPIRLPLLASLGDWEQAAAEIEKKRDFASMCTYVVPMMAWNEEKTLALFGELASNEVEQATGRGAYRKIIQQLALLEKSEAGKQAAADLAQRWRKAYPRRKAMLEELENAGV